MANLFSPLFLLPPLRQPYTSSCDCSMNIRNSREELHNSKESNRFAKISLDVLHRYEKNIDAANFDVMHAETKQLQKMSLSDPQEQNKEKNLVGSGTFD
ncbi:hypothetical protein Tco_1429149 [Tanacetum coccineum]